jgi:PAS domain-containing protein
VATRPEATITRPARPSLRLIRGRAHDTPGWTCFCGECTPTPADEPVSPLAHVCGPYGAGLLLETRLDAFPTRDDAFLVIDSRLRVQTVSRQAATLLGESEEDMIDRPVAEFLESADTEVQEPEDFLQLIRHASTDSDERHSVFVRPQNAFGIRMIARIAPCGPPRAALVLLRSRALQVEICHGALR